MKRFWLALLVVVVLGGLLGNLLVRDSGYVLVAYADWVVETSLWVALGLLAGAVTMLVAAVALAVQIVRGQGRVRQWQATRKQRHARQQTLKGLLVMAEGRWEEAQTILQDAAAEVETPLINYLNAARAAHELADHTQRDALLRRAHESTPGAKFAVTLTQAEFNVEDGHYEQALASLLNLRKRAPKHRAVLGMLGTCYEALGDWQALGELMADLKKYKAVGDGEIQRIERVVWQAALRTGDDVAGLWNRLPRALKTDTALLRQWVRDLLDAGRTDAAEAVIRQIQEVHWQPDLARWYGEIAATDSTRQLLVAQNWLKQRPNDAEVALTVGRLYLRNERFEQAREAFEISLRLAPNDDVYGELGRLCVALGDERRGTEYLMRSLGRLADLPQPAKPSIRGPMAS